MMKRLRGCFVIFIFLFGIYVPYAMADESATPKEIVQKVHEAVKLIQEKGEAAFEVIRDPKGPFVWKDSYIFVYRMDGTIVAHPNHKLENKNFIGVKDIKGNMFAAEFVSIAKSEKGEGWSEYWWPKLEGKEASRKISFIKKVAGTDYFLGAGVYSDLPMEEVIKATQQ